jgi:hypothetical protein
MIPTGLPTGWMTAKWFDPHSFWLDPFPLDWKITESQNLCKLQHEKPLSEFGEVHHGLISASTTGINAAPLPSSAFFDLSVYGYAVVAAAAARLARLAFTLSRAASHSG